MNLRDWLRRAKEVAFWGPDHEGSGGGAGSTERSVLDGPAPHGAVEARPRAEGVSTLRVVLATFAGGLMIVALSSDFWGLKEFWTHHAMTAAVVSGLVFVVFTAVVVQWIMDRVDTRRWRVVGASSKAAFLSSAADALRAIEAELKLQLTGAYPREQSKSAEWHLAYSKSPSEWLLFLGEESPDAIHEWARFAVRRLDDVVSQSVGVYPLIGQYESAELMGELTKLDKSLRDVKSNIITFSSLVLYASERGPSPFDDQWAERVATISPVSGDSVVTALTAAWDQLERQGERRCLESDAEFWRRVGIEAEEVDVS